MNDLLKVLDMSEVDQWNWVCRESSYSLGQDFNSFADLAFRLRDEVVKQNLTMWRRAMDIIFLNANEEHWKEKKSISLQDGQQ